ncbi:response regulator, partial [Paenibacillus sp. MCAF20]
MESIRVMLVDDDPFWRSHIGMDLAVEPDIQMVGVAATKEEAVALAIQELPDVILMDINLTGNNLDGLDAAEQILRDERTRSAIVIM